MVIIAFSEKTSKILPRIICRRFRHCAPITPMGRGMILHQFSSPGHITKIPINIRGISRLQKQGWRFIYLPIDAPGNLGSHAFSCVDLSKRALRLNAPHIQTPDALYRHLRK